MLNSPAFIRLRRRFAETGLISARQERLPPSSRVAGLWWARNAKVYEKTQKPDSNVLTAPRLLQLLAFRLQPWLRQAFVSTVLPLLQTNSGRPKRLFSARTFRATRCKARSARTTNAGVAWCFPFLAWLPFLFIRQSTVAHIQYHG